MKIISGIIALSGLALTSFAQPVVQHALNYSIGDSMRFMNCNTSVYNPGDTGINKTWRFNNLVVADSSALKIIAPANASAGSQFPNADLVESYSDGTEVYIKNTTAAYNRIGVVKGTTNIRYPDAQLLMQRPFSYGSGCTDTFTEAGIAGGYTVHARGYSSFRGVGYGTLELSTKSYDNVLKVELITTEFDTLVNASLTYAVATNSVSYLWFDTVHSSALLQLDSFDVQAPTQNTQILAITYLVENNPLAVPTVKANASDWFNCHIDDNGILIRGAFSYGQQYAVSICNMAGQQVFAGKFITTTETQFLKSEQPMPSGLYVVRLNKDGAEIRVQKVFKE